MKRLHVAWVMALVAAVPLAAAQPSPAPVGTLDRIRDSGRIRLGYRTDARPFSYLDDAGNAAGYSIALCGRIADAVKNELRLPGLDVRWVPVTAQDRFRAVQQGGIDVLCGADTVTLERRRDVAFSIPVFPGGIGALLRADAPARLREVLDGRGQTFRPTWRAAATQVLHSRAFSAVAGTTAETWLTERIKDLDVVTTLSPAVTYDAGVQAVLDRRVDALFGERAILLDAAHRSRGPHLIVAGRLFTYEPLALTLARDDERFRLLVDGVLAKFYASGGLGALYTTWFGEPDESALTFFRWNTLP
jgi:ABC-type amino acid transport substrate-binding protein